MGYKIIKYNAQVPGEAYKNDGTLYLPLNYLWSNFSILEKEKVLFLDSPLADLNIGLIYNNDNTPKSYFTETKRLLEGSGCNVKIASNQDKELYTFDLLLCLSNMEGIFKTEYNGLSLNGSKKLADNFRWSLIKMFELDYISPPQKRSIENLTHLTTLKKISIPVVNINWRSKDCKEESYIKLGLSILIGLLKFTTNSIPEVNWEIFLTNISSQNRGKNQETQNTESKENTDKIINHDNTASKATLVEIAPRQDKTIVEPSKDVKLKKEDSVMTKANKDNKRGKIVKNPTPAQKIYLKKMLEKQNKKMKNNNIVGKPASKSGLKT
ncbi:hypothetical protein PRVXT_000553 [Proteinivorax tanatarense]|uniref:Uncharacterized protein n=1 Tax=Proteinivorax tanatarense TaxID=1260629 RepID=A0AAU7VMY5_9FIRM